MELIGLVAGVLTVLGVVVGLTRYFDQLQYRTREAELRVGQERERAESATATAALQTQLNDARLEKAALTDQLANFRELVARAGRGTESSIALKDDIDTKLLTAMHGLRATASSILVVEPSPTPVNLVFFSCFGPAAATLRHTRVPITKGVAGYVFSTGKRPASDHSGDSHFFDAVDKRTKFETRELLCVPVEAGGERIGVVQFLNRSDTRPFSDDDYQTALSFASLIGPQVAEFTRTPDNFALLGVTPTRPRVEASILVADLTASGRLLAALQTSEAVDLINEYLERQCDIAIRHGGVVDGYAGDGAMIRFNVPRPVEDFVYQAARAAIEMRADFQDLKASWQQFGLPVDETFSRTAIATGEVHETVLGHRSLQQVTVIGEPVYRAYNLCESARRDESVVVLDTITRDRLRGRIVVGEVAAPSTGEPLRELRRLA